MEEVIKYKFHYKRKRMHGNMKLWGIFRCILINHDKKLQKVWKKEIKTFLEMEEHFIEAVLKPLIETTAAKRGSTGWWSQMENFGY